MMCRALDLSFCLLSLSSFIACFGTLNMLNKIVHIHADASVHVSVRVSDDSSNSERCSRTIIVDNIQLPHLTWLELFYMRWTVVLTLVYSFLVMIMIRAKYMSHFQINQVTSNGMMLVGTVLAVVLLISTTILHERTPFVEVWCNNFIIYYLYYIDLNTIVAVAYFIYTSCYLLVSSDGDQEPVYIM
ncbi:uncharacterized protein [Drosophila pseudoobscura]|uniref:Uncharacterized protein n=1 Tax=Drosophila pseudoobscura pseudoobscura TaxID=46245 RepID=A0A6I8UYZ1_DROPS|nr:uncharacterized protein LOC6902318 [Drosophila pseudoobscura]